MLRIPRDRFHRFHAIVSSIAADVASPPQSWTTGENPRKATLAAASEAAARPNWRAKARITCLSAQNRPQLIRRRPHRAPTAPLEAQLYGEGRLRGLQRASNRPKWARTGPFWRKRPVWSPTKHRPVAPRHLIAARDATAHAQAGVLRIPRDRFHRFHLIVSSIAADEASAPQS